MSNIIALGCSLTAQKGYINFLNEKHNLNILNLAEVSGSNGLQMFRLSNLLYKNIINEETILLWQITGLSRPFSLFYKDINPLFLKPSQVNHVVYTEEQLFSTKEIFYNLLGNNNFWNDKRYFVNNTSFNLQNLICDVYKWSKIVKKIILHLGWSSIAEPELIYKNLEILKSCENVKILPIEYSILDWCISNKIPLDETRHPSVSGYVEWCCHVFEPFLKKHNVI